MGKNKTILRICLWIEYCGVLWMPVWVAISGIILLVCYEQFIKAENITGFTETQLIPVAIALSIIIIFPAVFRWVGSEIKHIDEDFKKLKDKKDGTF
jgi:hypothetical protein